MRLSHRNCVKQPAAIYRDLGVNPVNLTNPFNLQEPIIFVAPLLIFGEKHCLDLSMPVNRESLAQHVDTYQCIGFHSVVASRRSSQAFQDVDDGLADQREFLRSEAPGGPRRYTKAQARGHSRRKRSGPG